MQQYLDLLSHICQHGDNHNDRTGVGTTSIFGYQMRFDLANGFPILTTKRLSFKWIAEELFWFISGSTDVEDLRSRGKQPITIWDEWADEETCSKFGHRPGQLGPIYSHQWRNAQAQRTVANYRKWYCNDTKRYINVGYLDNGIDQLMNICCKLLQENPRSRRIILSGWDPQECDHVALPPCHTLCQFKWHEETNKLDCQLYQRSADVFLGVPYNIASYSLLTVLLASIHGMIPGDFIHTFGDVHIYNTHPDQVTEQLNRQPRKLPTLEIDNNVSDIRDFEFKHLRLLDYDPCPSIKAQVAI